MGYGVMKGMGYKGFGCTLKKTAVELDRKMG
jgi:hypothetical protein